jgi:hypothetical protein
MKKLLAFYLILVVSLPALAVEDGQVMYVGGTAPGVTAGCIGRLNTTFDTELIFECAGTRLSIPYAAIQSFDYSTEVRRHLGVLPAVAIGLLKMRHHQHFFRISYRNPENTAQAAIFEVPKHMPRILQAVLETRAPRLCRPYVPCAGQN